MNDLIPITVQVRRVLPTDGHDDVAEKLCALEALMAACKQIRADVEQEAEEWIRENGPVTAGNLTYYIGITKKPPKCTDVPRALDALFTVCGGDFGKVAEHLSAGALKYGAAKRSLPPEQYAELFRQDEIEELQSKETKDARTLQKADVRFLESKH